MHGKHGSMIGKDGLLCSLCSNTGSFLNLVLVQLRVVQRRLLRVLQIIVMCGGGGGVLLHRPTQLIIVSYVDSQRRHDGDPGVLVMVGVKRRDIVVIVRVVGVSGVISPHTGDDDGDRVVTLKIRA